MKVVGLICYLFVDDFEVLQDLQFFELGLLQGCDLLVWVQVILVNLVDIKLWVLCEGWEELFCIFGFDVVGVVDVVGLEVIVFMLGDMVYYVGDVI